MCVCMYSDSAYAWKGRTSRYRDNLGSRGLVASGFYVYRDLEEPSPLCHHCAIAVPSLYTHYVTVTAAPPAPSLGCFNSLFSCWRVNEVPPSASADPEGIEQQQQEGGPVLRRQVSVKYVLPDCLFLKAPSLWHHCLYHRCAIAASSLCRQGGAGAVAEIIHQYGS